MVAHNLADASPLPQADSSSQPPTVSTSPTTSQPREYVFPPDTIVCAMGMENFITPASPTTVNADVEDTPELATEGLAENEAIAKTEATTTPFGSQAAERKAQDLEDPDALQNLSEELNGLAVCENEKATTGSCSGSPSESAAATTANSATDCPFAADVAAGENNKEKKITTTAATDQNAKKYDECDHEAGNKNNDSAAPCPLHVTTTVIPGSFPLTDLETNTALSDHKKVVAEGVDNNSTTTGADSNIWKEKNKREEKNGNKDKGNQ